MLKNLLDLDSEDMQGYFASLGEKPYRAKQLMRWIHRERETDFSLMTNLSAGLRKDLKDGVFFDLPRVRHEEVAIDGTRKWLLSVDGANSIEMVFIPDRNRGTLCISSQAGCALDCLFCSTGKQGFNRNLTTAEIVGQLWMASLLLDSKTGLSRTNNEPNTGRAITNIVMMGMGEPLANYKNVLKSLRIMFDDNSYGYSRRKVTVSTAGLVPAIKRLMEDCPVALAVSLHAPDNELRDKLVPINKKYPIATLLDACGRYIEKIGCVEKGRSHLQKLSVSPRDYITFEYVMLRQVNDSITQAKKLADLLSGFPCKINLIPFNPFQGSGLESSPEASVRSFQDVLKSRGFICTVRKVRGQEIDGACGQLAGQINDKTDRKRMKLVVN